MPLSAGLAVDIISQKALAEFNAQIAPLKSFALDFSDEAVSRIGKKIEFLWTGAQGTVKTFSSATGYEAEEPTQLPKDLTIDTRKYVGFKYTDEQLATLTMLDLEEIGKQYGAALALAVLEDLWSIITVENFGAAVLIGAADDFDSDDILDIGKVCTTAKWPKISRNMFVNEDYYTALAKDPAVKDASQSGGTEALRTGTVPNLGTFENVFESTVIPDNAENLVGFAALRRAIGIAFRPITPDQSSQKVMDYRVHTNESGMTIAFKEWYDPTLETTTRIMEVCYGKTVGDPSALKRIQSAVIA